VPIAREPEVLSTMATIVNKLKSTITPQIPKIFDALFECTLDMINKVRPYPQAPGIEFKHIKSQIGEQYFLNVL